MANLDVIVGGIGIIDVATIVYGGQEMVVGGAAKCGSRDKLLHLKHVPNDTKKLLAVINMSRPVVFGKIHYDDGDEKKLRAGPHMDEPDDALMTMLHERLHQKPDDVVINLVHEYKLAEPVYWALTELIQMLLKRIKDKRPNMRAVKINGDIGSILDRVRDGDEYFKVATDHKDWPKNMTAVVRELLDILLRERTPKGIWREPKLLSPQWPEMCYKNVNAMNDIAAKKYKTVRQYVEAIVLRDHILMNHMDAVEQYYIDSARDIQEYNSLLVSFFEKHARSTCSAEQSYVIKKTVPSSFIVSRQELRSE